MPEDMSQIALNYFASINPIANRIKLDIDEIANAYEYLWTQFSEHEKCDVINESLIKPDIVIKYFDSFLEAKDKKWKQNNAEMNHDKDKTESIRNNYLYDGKHLSTYAKQKTGLKKNQDDLCGVYRDEHSAPFSVKTKSQINLNLFDVDILDNHSLLMNTSIGSSPPISSIINVTTIISTTTTTTAATTASSGTQLKQQPPQDLSCRKLLYSQDQKCDKQPSPYMELIGVDKEELPLLQFVSSTATPATSSSSTFNVPLPQKGSKLTNFYLLCFT